MNSKIGNINKPFMPQGNIPFAQVGIAKWYNGIKMDPGMKVNM